MTVQELIDKLKALGDTERVVILSGDEEGNSYGTLSQYSIDSYNDSVILWPCMQYERAEDAIEASKGE